MSDVLCLAIPIPIGWEIPHSPTRWRRGDQNTEQAHGREDTAGQAFWLQNHCHSTPQSYPHIWWQSALVRNFYVPHSVLSPLHVLSHLSLITILWSRYIILPILQTMRLKHKEVEHAASERWSWDPTACTFNATAKRTTGLRMNESSGKWILWKQSVTRWKELKNISLWVQSWLFPDFRSANQH